MILRDFLDGLHADHVRLGFRSGNCMACTPSSWHDDARAGRLRAAVVGGLPLDPNERPGAEPTGVARDRIAGDPRVTVGGSVDQPDGDLAGARRAIASATPGRKHHRSRRGRSHSLLRDPDGPGALSEALASTSRTKAGLPPDRPDSLSGAGRVDSPRASATSSRQAAESVVSRA